MKLLNYIIAFIILILTGCNKDRCTCIESEGVGDSVYFTFEMEMDCEDTVNYYFDNYEIKDANGDTVMGWYRLDCE